MSNIRLEDFLVPNEEIFSTHCRTRIINALRANGINTKEELINKLMLNGDVWFMRLPGFGKKALNSIKKYLPTIFEEDVEISPLTKCPLCKKRIKPSDDYLLWTNHIKYKCIATCSCGLFMVKEIKLSDKK